MRRAEFPFHEEQGEFLEQADEPRLCRASAHAQLLHSWNMVNLFLIQLSHFARRHLMLWCTEIRSCDTFWWRQKLLFEFSLSPTLSQTNCFLFNREYNSSKGTPHRRKFDFFRALPEKGGGGPCPIFLPFFPLCCPLYFDINIMLCVYFFVIFNTKNGVQ